LESHQARLTPILWAELENARLGDASLLASAGALALFDPESPRWVDLGGKVAQALVTVNSIVLGTWLDSLRPIRGRLTAPLVAISRDKTRPEDEHTQATDILVDYARDEPGRLAEVLMAADSKAFRKLFPVAERQAAMVVPLFQAAIAPTSPAGKYEAASEQQARAAIALIRLGHAEEVWPLLRHSSDPRLRSFLVNWLLPLGVDPRSIAAELFRRNHATSLQPVLTTSNMDTILFHPETSIRRALILGLGEIIAGQELSSELTSPERDRIVKSLLASYRNDVDAGVHSAAEWTLRRWQLGDELEKIDLAAMSSSLSEGSRWFGSSSGHVMSIIRGPVEFWMGSPLEESERDNDEFPHHEKLRHSFAIAIKEITVKQFGKFLQKNPRIAGEEASGLSSHKTLSVDPNTARNAVTWYEAAAYCNWLSKEEGFQESQLCYLPNKDGQYAEGMRIVPDLLMRTGYRLPTEAEWEYVCRSGSDTSRPYGTTEELLDNYAWYLKNDEGYRPGGEKKPNDLGLFDTLGNVWEWCHDEYNHYSLHISKKTFSELDLIVIDKKLRVLRGAAIDDDAKNVRSANRGWNGPSFRYGDYGFRIARTLP
jgi:formylglycine-generating enzyme required for sulfatase activity